MGVDDESGVRWLRIDRGNGDVSTRNFQSTFQETFVDDGTYTFAVSVLDAAMNESVPYAVAVTVDHEPPEVIAPMVVNGGDAFTNERLVNLHW